jgi:hypothetical protein
MCLACASCKRTCQTEKETQEAPLLQEVDIRGTKPSVAHQQLLAPLPAAVPGLFPLLDMKEIVRKR